MPTCIDCSQSHFGVFDLKNGVCRKCREVRSEKVSSRQFSKSETDAVIITTEMISPFPVIERLGIVSGESALGIGAIQDIGMSVTDTVGGESGIFQNRLREAKERALKRLKSDALELGGNAVIAVNLNFSEMTGRGKSALFVVATGTAVTAKF